MKPILLIVVTVDNRLQLIHVLLYEAVYQSSSYGSVFTVTVIDKYVLYS